MGTGGAQGTCRVNGGFGGDAGTSRPRRLPALLLVVAVTVAAVSGCAKASRTTTGAPQGTSVLVTTTFPCPPQPQSDGGDGSGCGNASLKVQHDANMHYADRMPITGSDARAEAWQPVIRRALEPLAKDDHQASQQQVQDVLKQLLPAKTFIQVSWNAVATAGTAFGVEIGDACVIGSVYGHILTVEVSGFINDGGCLAVNAH